MKLSSLSAQHISSTVHWIFMYYIYKVSYIIHEFESDKRELHPIGHKRALSSRSVLMSRLCGVPFVSQEEYRSCHLFSEPSLFYFLLLILFYFVSEVRKAVGSCEDPKAIKQLGRVKGIAENPFLICYLFVVLFSNSIFDGAIKTEEVF